LIIGWNSSDRLHSDYRNTPAAVKAGYVTSLPYKFACKDFVAMLIEYVSNRCFGL